MYTIVFVAPFPMPATLRFCRALAASVGLEPAAVHTKLPVPEPGGSSFALQCVASGDDGATMAAAAALSSGGGGAGASGWGTTTGARGAPGRGGPGAGVGWVGASGGGGSGASSTVPSSGCAGGREGGGGSWNRGSESLTLGQVDTSVGRLWRIRLSPN